MHLSRILALTIVLAACSNDDGSGAPFARIDQLDATYHQVYCTHLVSCGEFPDQATCLAANVGPFPLQLSMAASNADVVAAVLAGNVIYNGTRMQQCIDAIAGQTCDQTDQDGRVNPVECGETLRGTIGAGGVCHLDVECVSQVCNTQCGELQSGCCAGTCVGDAPPILQLRTIGESCGVSVTYLCEVGAFCDNRTATCAPLQTAGTPCTLPSQCDYGLSCTGDLLCGALPRLGEACPNFECRDEGTICKAGTCVAVGLPSVACTSSTDCSSYYQCDATTNECAPMPRNGESCATAGRCFDVDSYCDETQLCAEKAENGQPCTSSTGCKSGECMISELGGVCVAPTTCI